MAEKRRVAVGEATGISFSKEQEKCALHDRKWAVRKLLLCRIRIRRVIIKTHGSRAFIRRIRLELSSRDDRGCGKGVAAKNLLARASPPFERIVVYHYDVDTLEWDDCEPSDVIAELPDDPSEFWDREQKNLLIMDEIPWETLPKADRMKADRCLQYVASHYNLSVYVLHQNFVSIPTPIRRAADWWNLWGSVDNVSVRDVSSKTGHDFRQLLQLTKSKFDA